MRFIKV